MLYLTRKHTRAFQFSKKYHKNRYKMLAFVKFWKFSYAPSIKTRITLRTDDKPVITHWPRAIWHIFLVSYIFAQEQKYKKLETYLPYCTRHCAITSTYIRLSARDIFKSKVL